METSKKVVQQKKFLFRSPSDTTRTTQRKGLDKRGRRNNCLGTKTTLTKGSEEPL